MGQPTGHKQMMAATAAMLMALATGCPAKGTPPAPALAPLPMRSVEVTPEKVAAGRATFGVCAGCHGAEGEGRLGIGPRLTSGTFLAGATDAFLIRTITEGRAGTTMIGWGGSFDAKQIESVVAYLRSSNPVGAATLDEAPLLSQQVAGARVFRSICSQCHGHHGGGYQESSNGTGIGRAAFLNSATNGFIRHIVREGKTHTAMHGFSSNDPAAVANLTNEEIDGVIAFLRANAW